MYLIFNIDLNSSNIVLSSYESFRLQREICTIFLNTIYKNLSLIYSQIDIIFLKLIKSMIYLYDIYTIFGLCAMFFVVD